MNLKALASRAKTNPSAGSSRLHEQFKNLLTKGSELRAIIRPASTLPDTIPVEGLLSGLSFTVKDNIGLAQGPITWGIEPPAIEYTEKDAEIVSCCKTLGAICTASTNLDPLALGAFGENNLFGNTLNPRNRKLIVGGSSAGAASAVTAGLCDFAICSDCGGSARIPALCCGVSALKFTPDRFSKRETVLLDDAVDCFGIVAAEMQDIEFVCSSLLKGSYNGPIKLIFPNNSDLKFLDPDLAEDFSRIISNLAKSFALEQCRFPLPFQESLNVRKAIMAKALSQKIAELGINKSSLPDEALALIKMAEGFNGKDCSAVNAERQVLSDKIVSMLSSGALLLTPGLPYAVPTREKPSVSPLPINYFLALSNLCGLPAVTFPIGVTGGIQLAGLPGSELQITSVGATLQALLIRN